MSTPLISVQDLSVEIKTDRGLLKAIRGVSFDVNAGDSIGIVGESGSGKSITLKAILGLLPASLATGLGSDVQRPLATVIVWGLFSSTILTLFVVPVLYFVFRPIVVQKS